MKTERTQIPFLSDVLVAVASLDLKVSTVIFDTRFQNWRLKSKPVFRPSL